MQPSPKIKQLFRVFFKESLLLVISGYLAFELYGYVLDTFCCCTNKVSIVSILATSAITAFGFVLTTIAILTAVVDRSAIKNLDKLNKLSTLINRTIRTAAGFLAMFISSLGLVLVQDVWAFALLLSISTFFLVWSILMFIRIGRWYYLILKIL